MKKLLLTTALVTTFGISAATAAPVNSLLGGTNQINDRSAETLINKPGSATNDTTLDIGDKLRGILNIDTIDGTGIGTANPSVNELTAIFEVEVINIATGPDGFGGLTYFYTFGPSASFATEIANYGFVGTNDAAIVFFEDSSPDFTRDGTLADGFMTAGAGSITGAAGYNMAGTLDAGVSAFWSFGFDGIDDYWLAKSSSNDVTAASLISPPLEFGSFNLGLSLFENPTGRDLNQVDCNLSQSIMAVVNACGSGSLFSPNASTGFEIFNRADFTVSAIPEPASLGLLGLGLMGIGFAARRRKQS